MLSNRVLPPPSQEVSGPGRCRFGPLSGGGLARLACAQFVGHRKAKRTIRTMFFLTDVPHLIVFGRVLFSAQGDANGTWPWMPFLQRHVLHSQRTSWRFNQRLVATGDNLKLRLRPGNRSHSSKQHRGWLGCVRSVFCFMRVDSNKQHGRRGTLRPASSR